jgi:hypothetical protein
MTSETCTTGGAGARICPHSGILAPAEGANGSFVSRSRLLRRFVFNEIGSFVPLKNFLLPVLSTRCPAGQGVGCVLRDSEIPRRPGPSTVWYRAGPSV